MGCPQNSTYDALIQAAALGYGIDPALLKAHMAVESSFNPHATNLEGSGVNPSAGLMQVRLSTARALGYPGQLGNSDLLSGLYDPGTNVPLAAKLIRENLDRAAGDVDAAISAYNGGWSADKGFGSRFADGTFGNQTYVNRVRTCYASYAGQFGDQFGDVSGGGSTTAPAPPADQAGLTSAPTALLMLALAALLALVYYVRQRMQR